ncbi:MAG TPA: toxin-antitoxin system HicB family antitoxin [Kofleriaceae bacterium]|nr:toxin-antitoxin system HicB family antitoxin [Kofleriaceae bacterium]
MTMLDETVTLRLPEELHHRLAAAAAATRRSLEEIGSCSSRRTPPFSCAGAVTTYPSDS